MQVWMEGRTWCIASELELSRRPAAKAPALAGLVRGHKLPAPAPPPPSGMPAGLVPEFSNLSTATRFWPHALGSSPPTCLISRSSCGLMSSKRLATTCREARDESATGEGERFANG